MYRGNRFTHAAWNEVHVVDETIRKTRFPCKVMDKDGNVKKIIAPQEMPETSYKWDKQPYPSKRRNKNA